MNDATMNTPDLPNELVDRGIYWQIGGFALVAIASVSMLAEFAGSENRTFLYFEVAATKLYWAFIIPLAGLFDGVRKMFEKMSDLRAKRKQMWLAEGRQEGRRQERERMREELQRLGVALPQEAVDYLDGKSDDVTS